MDYRDTQLRDPDVISAATLIGNGTAMMSNQISHFFDLRGPSMTIDTGCSASMVALHLACQSIRNGESRIALVGGSNILLNPDNFISMGGLGYVISSAISIPLTIDCKERADC
jgi:acyl transferase domain-containing protein